MFSFSELFELFWLIAEALTMLGLYVVCLVAVCTVVAAPFVWLAVKIERKISRRRRRREKLAFQAYVKEMLTK